MTDQIQTDSLLSQQLADKIISFVCQVAGESAIIEVYGDAPECRWCEQLGRDITAGDLISEYFKSRGQNFVLKYVEHYIDMLFNFTDGLKYKIIIYDAS